MKTSFLPLRLAATTAVFSFLAGAALAQAPAPGAPAAPAAPGTAAAPAEKPKPLSSSDKTFVKNASGSLQYQIQIADSGKTASAFSDPKSPLVRLRDTTSKDLKKAWEALNKIAQAHGETLATDLTGSDKMAVERLGKIKDDKFAKQWCEDLVKESKKLDRDFDTAAKAAQDPDLKTYASNYGPSVRNVFTSAEAAEKGLNAKKK